VNWQAVAVVAATIIFFVLRFSVRRWIIERWISGRLSSSSAVAGLGVLYVAPIVALVMGVAIADPAAITGPGMALVVGGAVVIGAIGGLLDFAVMNGMRSQLRQNRDARLKR
jgi:hypothetical protein